MKALEEHCKDQDDCLQQALIENFIHCKPKHYGQDWSGLAELLNDVGLTSLAKSILAIYMYNTITEKLKFTATHAQSVSPRPLIVATVPVGVNKDGQ
jgi:hypothetical protein